MQNASFNHVKLCVIRNFKVKFVFLDTGFRLLSTMISVCHLCDSYHPVNIVTNIFHHFRRTLQACNSDNNYIYYAYYGQVDFCQPPIIHKSGICMAIVCTAAWISHITSLQTANRTVPALNIIFFFLLITLH